MTDNTFSINNLDADIFNDADQIQPVITTSDPLLFPDADVVNGSGVGEVQAEVSNNKPEINVTVIGEGPIGPRGYSAYELWLQQGNVGTIEQYISSTLSYEHPATHSADMIVGTDEKQFVSLADKLRLSGYVHTQIVASKRWVISHPLDKFPSVSVVDTGGNLVGGDIEYVSRSELIATFSSEFSGDAYLN